MSDWAATIILRFLYPPRFRLTPGGVGSGDKERALDSVSASTASIFGDDKSEISPGKPTWKDVDILSSGDSATKATTQREELEDDESAALVEVRPPEKTVPAVRMTREKMILPMTQHAKPGVPARDRPGRAPPHPRDLSGVPAKKIPRLEGEVDADECDPVWLKDKADKFMVPFYGISGSRSLS